MLVDFVWVVTVALALVPVVVTMVVTAVVKAVVITAKTQKV
jgi:hypothetical protein